MPLELLTQFGTMALSNPIVIAAEVAIIRSVSGYCENLAKKGWEGFSFRKLIETALRVIPQAIGLNALIPGAGIGALVTDYVITKVKK